MSMIEITRPVTWSDKARAYKLLLDGQEVGRIKEGETLTLETPPGEHRLEARIDWCAAEPLMVLVEKDEPAQVVVYNTHGPVWGLLAVTFWMNRYLTLEQTEA